MDKLKERHVLDGRFQILERIGEGGMGTVYAGVQLGLGRKVAIKTLNPEFSGNEDLVARFRREAHIIQNLTHPNTVRLYDFGETPEGHLYIVMEYLEGRTFDQVIAKRQRIPVQTVVDLAKQVLGSLIEAHAQGIVHRDLKPSNLMLCEQLGADNHVKVLDFGLARADIEQVSLHTYSGAVMGTPHYMSPEQARGHRVGSASDLYSLSLTLFEMVMGSPAYQASSPYELAMHHLTSDPLVIPSLLASTRLGSVIAKGAEKSLEDRYQSAQEMLEALSDPLPNSTAPRLELTGAAERDLFGDDGDTEETAVVPASIPPTAEWPRKRGWVIPALSVAGLLAIGTVAAVVLFGGDDGGTDVPPPAGETISPTSDSEEQKAPTVVESEPVDHGLVVAAPGPVAERSVDEGVVPEIETSPPDEDDTAAETEVADAPDEERSERPRESRRRRDTRRDRDDSSEDRTRTAVATEESEEQPDEVDEGELVAEEELAVVEEPDEEPEQTPEDTQSTETPSLMDPVVGGTGSGNGEVESSSGSNEEPSNLPINF